MTVLRCIHCNVTFAHSSSLYRHKKNYCKKFIKQINTKNKSPESQNDYEIKLKIYEERFKNYEEKEAILMANNKFMEKRLEVADNLVKSAGGMVASSMSAITYAMKNYKDAPMLEAIQDYDSVIDNTDNKFVKNLATNYRRKICDKYLGDYLIKYYKKDDPNKQSKWNSDTQRLHYIIRSKLDNDVEWVVDKKGIKVINTVIKPFLSEVRSLCTDYMKELDIKIKKSKGVIQQSFLNDLITLGELVGKINNNTFANDILKYITPHFYLNKEIVI